MNRSINVNMNKLELVVDGGLANRNEMSFETCLKCKKNLLFMPLQYKNLAIANRSRVSCINTNNNTMTLKSGLEVTQGH